MAANPESGATFAGACVQATRAQRTSNPEANG
jgi:hypothetical protein